jgi:hypothetical protein
MTNKLVVIINSLKVPKIKKILLYEMKSCTKLQLPPEPLTRGLLPPDPLSLCPLSSSKFVDTPPNKIPGYATAYRRYTNVMDDVQVTETVLYFINSVKRCAENQDM